MWYVIGTLILIAVAVVAYALNAAQDYVEERDEE